MPSKIQVDQIAGATGSTVTLPSGQTLDLSSGTVTLPSTALSALNATNLTSGTVPSARLSLTSSDLPTVPTTKGGTGLTALGTAGQALKVNSGATGLEFGDISSGVDLIAEGSFTSVGSIVLTNTLWDSSTYRFHEIYIRLLNSGGNNSGNGTIQYSTDGGSTYLGSGLSGNSIETNSSVSGVSYRNEDNAGIITIAGDGIRDEFGMLHMTWASLNLNTQKTFEATWVRPNHDGTTRMKANHTFGIINNGTTSSTIKIGGFTSTPTFTGTYKIFGRK